MNPDTFRIRVDAQIRFEYATCGWKYFFLSGKKKLGLNRVIFTDALFQVDSYF